MISESLIKKTTAILIIFSLTFHCIFQLGLFTYFLAHQDFIVKELCINRTESQNSCQGSCFMENKLSAGEHEKDETPYQHIQLQEINFYLAKSVTFYSALEFINANDWYLIDQTNWYSCYRKSIFQPPRFLVELS